MVYNSDIATLIIILVNPQIENLVGAFHDAVILYALALNETLQAGGSISDGADITRRMWNRTFEGRAAIIHLHLTVYDTD